MRPIMFDISMCSDTVQVLLAAQSAIASPLEPHVVLKTIVKETLNLSGADLCLLYVVEGDRLVVAAQAGGTGPRLLGLTAGPRDSALWQVLHSGEAQWLGPAALHRIPGQSSVAVPLYREDQALGVLVAAATRTNNMHADILSLLKLLAPGAAQALHNAYRYIHAQRRAAMLERKRMARQLQAVLSGPLFSAFLIADVLPRLYDRNPEEGRLQMEELRQITCSALAELKPLTEMPPEEG